MEFIDEKYICDLVSNKKLNDQILQYEIIEKARAAKGLNLKDCASLLLSDSEEIQNKIFETANFIKNFIYGNRLVLFAPLYISNVCVNNCLYCAFRKDNEKLSRKTLSLKEIKLETETLVQQGHKRILLVTGEHPKKSTLSYLGNAISTIYSVKINGNNIRRINVNSSPMSESDFKTLKNYRIGTYQCFQETYHFETYRNMHPEGPKRNYSWRLNTMERALKAGIDDVGIGVLFGLTDYRFEVLALLTHAFYLDKKYGIGPHTLSIPRLEPALNAPAANHPPYAVSDKNFKKIVAILRLAVPYTGIILSTREKTELRREIFSLGVSQISAGSKTSPGAYVKNGQKTNQKKLEQFQLGDHRDLADVISDCCELGFLPSFCTSCYRSKRTGDRFMKLAKSGDIGKICGPNAIFTFQEYINDYLSADNKIKSNDFLEKEIVKLDIVTQVKIRGILKRINKGERDIYL